MIFMELFNNINLCGADQDDLLSAKSASELIGCSITTIYNYRDNGFFTEVKDAKGYFKRSEVIQLKERIKSFKNKKYGHAQELIYKFREMFPYIKFEFYKYDASSKTICLWQNPKNKLIFMYENDSCWALTPEKYFLELRRNKK